MKFTGGCQCGAVRYRAHGPRDRASICYCRMCQRASGAPFMAFVRFAAKRVEWLASPAVFASSNIIERGFCKSCGTPLSYRNINGDFISLTIHSLDQPEAVTPEIVFSPEMQPSWCKTLDALQKADMEEAVALVNYQYDCNPISPRG